jgi:glycosyltransferase involved in cell wall biosynthesis
MRLLWLTETYPPRRGGMAQSCDRIVRGLTGAGVEVDVVQFTRHEVAGRVAWRFRRQVGGRMLTAPLGEEPEHALRHLATLVDGEPYTHVVAFGGTWPVAAAPVLAGWVGAPLLTLLRGNDLDTAVFSPRRRLALAEALRASAAVCVVASSHRRLVRLLAPDAEVVWVANSVDTTDWTVLPSERGAAARWRAARVTPGRRVLGAIGQLKAKKGLDLLLDALAGPGRADRVHLAAVGELDDAVTSRLTAEGIEHSVRAFADRSALPAVYAACDVVALPSLYDGMPNVALEAAALGVPLLASDAGGLADLVDDGIGFTFRAGDPVGCGAAVDRFLDAGDDALAKLGAAAAERVARDFTPAAETAGYLGVLERTRR